MYICCVVSTSAPADLATEVSNAASSVAASNGHMEAAATDRWVAYTVPSYLSTSYQ